MKGRGEGGGIGLISDFITTFKLLYFDTLQMIMNLSIKISKRYKWFINKYTRGALKCI